MSKTLKIFRSIKKELKGFEKLFDTYLEELEFSDYLSNTKGKMLRPALTILAAKAAGKVEESTLWAAIAVEMMHNATLVHDDIVDDANQRRSQPTFRSLQGDKKAVLYGDYLFAKSLECVVRTGDFRIIGAIANTTGEMSIGEIEQLGLSGSFGAQEQDYLDVIYKKTATLFICSLLVGYYSSSPSSDLEETVRKIGFNLGMAFQVKDDLLDYDKSGKSGKAFGNDIREQKMTLPIIAALAKADDKEVDRIKKMINLPAISDDEITYVIDFAFDKGGIAYTESALLSYLAAANNEIAKLPDNDSRIGLELLSKYLLDRDK